MNRISWLVALVIACAAGTALAARNATVYFESGGDRLVAVSGGSVDIATGAEMDVESGGALKIAGTAVTSTAAELNTLDLSAVGALVKVKEIEISANFDNTEQSTGWDLPAKAVVIDCWFDVATADTSQTIDIGTATADSGDPDGFLDGASVNGTGIQKGVLTAGGVTMGALFRETVTDSGTETLSAKTTAVSQGGKTIVYTGSDTTNTVRGSIYIMYVEIG